MNYILTLAKSLKADPRDCFVKFFTNIENMNDTYRKDFQKELEDLRIRVKGFLLFYLYVKFPFVLMFCIIFLCIHTYLNRKILKKHM